MSLVRWFRKNNRKLMAIFVVAIMIAFVIPSVLQQLSRPGGAKATVAYFDTDRKEPDEEKKYHVPTGEIEIIAAFIDDRIVAFFDLGKGTAETELFRHPGNGQIKAAYCLPEYRGRGIGKALLAEAVLWAKRNGLERLCVEGESANIYGGNFWISHFHPAQYAVRRCVDDRVRKDMFSDA